MNLCNISHSFNYETEKLCRLFLPFEKIEILNKRQESEIFAVTELCGEIAKAELNIGKEKAEYTEKIELEDGETEEKCAERAVALALYNCFCSLYSFSPSWGILTGVRPGKLYSALKRDNGSLFADNYFKEKLRVKEKKINLCKLTSVSEEKVVALSKPSSFSLYISIPFCPSRCSYCSFVSHSVEKSRKLIPLYLENLKKEIKLTGKIAQQIGLKLETIYIGGGTPTTLSAIEIKELMQAVKESFDLSGVLEYTVEAGRPDTLTRDKLKAIFLGGADRISINPQTMNDDVLDFVGRRHTSSDTRKAFELARLVGFKNINMDVIAGLPTDTLDSFKNTIDEIIQMDPENVTVHSLSFKRASNLSINGEIPEKEIGELASCMVDYAYEQLTNKGILPYYMYRQSKTVGNLENVGYAKKGYEGYYNIYIMDETHSILGCGASAVTKLREPSGKIIERVFNYKYPYEYISGFEELAKRKEKILEFYQKYPL